MSLFSDDDLPAFRLRLAKGVAGQAELTDKFLLGQIVAAERDIARQLKVFLEPTAIFPYEPSEDEIEALEGKPYHKEPGYDYDPDFFQADSWGYIVLLSRPAISVSRIRMAYPSPHQTFYEIPIDWVRLDKKAGHIRLVPASSAFTAPLSAFIMQAMGGGRSIPFMIQVNYVAGLKDAKADWPDLVEVILKQATLSIIESEWRPTSGSISADGLSQSESFNPEKMRSVINEKLFGPKGSNGGLWTAIHGIGGSMLGVAM